MEMKDNFDDILRRRWEERQFPVDPLHREEMAKLLDTRKRRRALPIWWLAGLIGIAAVTVLLVSRSQSPASIQEDQALHQLQNNSTPVPGITQQQQAPETQTQDQTHQAATAGNLNTGSTLNESPTSPANQEQKVSTKSSDINYTRTNSNPSKIDRTDNGKTNAQERPTGPTTSGKENTPPAPVTRPDMAEGSRPLQPSVLTLEDEAPSDPVIASSDTDLSSEAENNASAISVSALRSDMMTDPLDPLDVRGIEWTASNEVGPIEPRRNQRRPLYLLAELGGGLVFGSQPEYAAGWKLNAGAGLGYNPNARVNLRWTAGYLMQQGGFDFERTSTVQQAGFGARSSFNTLTPERLHHVYSRFGAQYRIHRHILHGYLGAQWLYGAQGRISIQVQDQLAGNQESTDYTWLNLNGLKRLRWTSGLAYGYQLTPRMFVMAGTEIQLSGLTIQDPALQEEGYYWKGDMATFHPFININYILYAKR